MRQSQGFTLTEVLVVILLIAVVLAVFTVVFARARTHAPAITGQFQLRGVFWSLVVYSQGNNSYFPGLDSEGQPQGIRVEERLQTLMEANYFTPDYLICPMDNWQVIQPWSSGPMTHTNYSYAMLQVPVAGGRYMEWRDTLNPQAMTTLI